MIPDVLIQNRSNIQNTKKSKMGLEKQFQCFHCHTTFGNFKIKRRHEKECFKYINFLKGKFCKKCNKTYASKGGAREHVRLVHKQEYYREEKVENIVPDPSIIKPI